MEKLNVYFEIPNENPYFNFFVKTFLYPIKLLDTSTCFEMKDSRFLSIDTFVKCANSYYDLEVSSINNQLTSLMSYLLSLREVGIYHYNMEAVNLYKNHDLKTFEKNIVEIYDFIYNAQQEIKKLLGKGTNIHFTIIDMEQITKRFESITSEIEKLKSPNLTENDINTIFHNVCQILCELEESFYREKDKFLNEFSKFYVGTLSLVPAIVKELIDVNCHVQSQTEKPEVSDDKPSSKE